MNNDSDFFIGNTFDSENYLNYSDENNNWSSSNFQCGRGIDDSSIRIDTEANSISLYDDHLTGSISSPVYWGYSRDDQPYLVSDYIYPDDLNGQKLDHLNDIGLNSSSNCVADTTSTFLSEKVGITEGVGNNGWAINGQERITTGIESDKLDKLANFGRTVNQEANLGCESLIGSYFNKFGSSNLGNSCLSKSAAQVDFCDTEVVDKPQLIGDCIDFELPIGHGTNYLSDGDMDNSFSISDGTTSSFSNNDGIMIGDVDSSLSIKSDMNSLVISDIENGLSNTASIGINKNFNSGLELGAYSSRFPDLGDEFSLGGYRNDYEYNLTNSSISSNDLFLSDSNKEYQRNVKSYNYDKNFLKELSKINKELADIYKGVVEVNKEKPSDYKRHVANSLRELISNTIRCLLPQNGYLVEWLVQTNRKQLLIDKNGKLVPTRKGKLIYIFRDRPKRERKLVEDETKCINRLYNILNGPTHKLTTNISGELIDNYIQKVKNSLKILILLYNS